MQRRPQTPRILVIRHRYVGDLVLCAPVFHNLRQHFSNAQISLLTDEKYRDVQAANNDIDEILAMPGGNGVRAAWLWLRLLFQIKIRRYDIAIDLSSTGKTARLALWSGAQTISGYETKKFQRKTKKRIVLSSRSGAALENCHISDLYLRPLEALGIPIVSREVSLQVRPEDVCAAQQKVRAALSEPAPEKPLVMVHPGARLETRRWPAEKYAAVCDELQKTGACRILLLAGPGEAEIVSAVQRAMKTEAASLDAPLSVPALAATFACADLLICNDSGPMHVAAAVGTQIVALFGAQSVALWHPTSHSVALQAPMPCKHCLFPEKCRPPDDYQMMCIARIETDEVIRSALAFLNRLEAKK